MSNTDSAKAQATKKMVFAIADTIKELGSVPSGVLYAQLCGLLSFETYTTVIGLLKGAGVVRESHHVLTWVGPKY